MGTTGPHDDRKLFEMLLLDGAQAGLSWITILRKRENYRRAFGNFDPEKVSRYGKREISRLLKDDGIVRNRLKIESAVKNARPFLEVQREFGTFDAYIWQFVGGKMKVNSWKSLKQIPASTKESDAMSKDLKMRGFSFMQAAGLVNDHITSCYRHSQVTKLALS
jgi:DNA-3-methyladenine glycosylase I